MARREICLSIKAFVDVPKNELSTAEKDQLKRKLAQHQQSLESEEAVLEGWLEEEKALKEEIQSHYRSIDEVREGSGQWMRRHLREGWGPIDASTEQSKLEAELERLNLKLERLQERIETQRGKIDRRQEWINGINEKLLASPIRSAVMPDTARLADGFNYRPPR